VNGVGELITDVNVVIEGLFHSYPDDIDVMLEGPGGQKVMLMSDACGGHGMNAYGIVWDDEAPALMPDEGPGDVCAATRQRPTDRQPGDSLPPPAPPGAYLTSLSVFDLTDPSGTWRLWVADDAINGEGFFTGHFVVQLTTRQRASTAFTVASADVAEGGSVDLTVMRTGATSYTSGSVMVTSSPGTASAADFAPVWTRLDFVAGQTEKTVRVDTLEDGAAESAEAFTLALSSPSGDARLDGSLPATITIPANDGGLEGPDDDDGDSGADTTPPQTTITKAPKAKSKHAKAKFAFTADEAGASFECSRDGKPFASCSSPLKLKRLARGKHRLSVRAIDAAGNVDPTPANAKWRRVARGR
jgi:subtilisin-like proprotein convertase family protein